MTGRSPIIIKAEISPGTEDKEACKELVGTGVEILLSERAPTPITTAATFNMEGWS